MKRRLHSRVRRRRYEGGHHFYLDLRGRGLRGERIAIRDPSDPGWPLGGPTARTDTDAVEVELSRFGGRVNTEVSSPSPTRWRGEIPRTAGE